MNQHPDELHEHDALERITRPDVQPGEILGPEEQALRQAWLQLGTLLDDLQATAEWPKATVEQPKAAPAGSATARGWGWLLALAAVLLVALGLAVLRGLGIGSGAPQGVQIAEHLGGNPAAGAGAAVISPWEDPLDEQILAVAAALVALPTESPSDAMNLDALKSGLEEISSEMQNPTL